MNGLDTGGISELAAVLATLIVLAPALAAAAARATRLRMAAAGAAAVAGSAFSIGGALFLLSRPEGGVAVAAEWAPELWVTLSWRLEVAPLALTVLVAGVGVLVKQYAAAYFAQSPKGPPTLALLGAFESAMLGLTLADNLLLLFVFWELTGIVSFHLILSDPAKLPKSYGAARQALLVTVAGGLPLLVATLVLALATGTASLSELRQFDLPVGLQTLAFALVLPAVLTKSAQVPFHFWLPGAMAAPTPVSAYLHSATMVKAGIILLLYLYPVLGGSPLWTATLLPAGVVTCLWGSYRALGEKDIKLLMAWSTVSQLGLLTLTIGLGTDLAIRAAALHLFAHALFKAGLFLSVGAIEDSAGTRLLPELGGLGRGNRPLMLTVGLLAGSMAGLPPLAGFLSKELILKKAMLADWWVHAAAISGIVLGSIGTIAYCSRFFFEVFIGPARSAAAAGARRAKTRLLLAPAALALTSAAAGPGAYWIDRWFLEPFAASLLGRWLDAPELSLWYGLNAAFILSVLIVTVGYALDRALGLRFLRSPFPVGGERAVEALLEASKAVGALVSRTLSGATPTLYLALALAAGLAATPTLMGSSAAPPGDWNWAGSLTLVFLASALTALVAARGALTKVLLLSACGFAVAFLFRLMNAPDLMLTQLLVEVLLTILFALTLRYLGPNLPSEPKKSRPAPALFSLAGGLAAGALTLAVGQSTRPPHVREFYVQAGPAIADGLNLVNVVLTDFRALDTLMETLVVVLAAMGVGGLMRGRERGPSRGGDEPGPAAPGQPLEGLLPVMSRLVLPLAALFALILLLKGHNQPGGGFVAGLGLAVGAVLSLLTAGTARSETGRRPSAGTVALVGVALTLAACVAGVATAGSALTHLRLEVPFFGSAVQLNSVLVFDLGVALAVAGGVSAAARLLWRGDVKGGRP